MKGGVILVAICFLFYRREPVFAENSAVFEVIAPLPVVVEADQKTVFVVRITNRSTDIGHKSLLYFSHRLAAQAVIMRI